MSNTSPLSWVVCQIGAREHYVLAAEFAQQGRLDALVTDLWVPPGSAISFFSAVAGGGGRALRDRYRPGLSSVRVLTPGRAGMAREIITRLLHRRSPSWDRTHSVNRRLGRSFAAALRRKQVLGKRKPQAVFAYSYAALEVLREARRQGIVAILGQIDPGPGEVRLVEAIAARHGLPVNYGQSPKQTYWDRWRAECAVADRIVVNSNWSRDLLLEEGIPSAQVAVVPLAYEKSKNESVVPQHRFCESPKTDALTCLFLGQVTVRKGVVELLRAMQYLQDCNVLLTIAGHVEPRLEPLLTSNLPKNVQFLGPIYRSQVGLCYREADVFVLPTHSDGFAMTQLEAMWHGLPVIASRYCGTVVRDGIDGRLLSEVTPEAIAAVIRWFYEHRGDLMYMRNAARVRVRDFSSARVARLLDEVAYGARE